MAKAVIFDLGGVYFNIDWERIDKEMKKEFGISSLIRSAYGEDINALYNKVQIGKAGLQDVFAEICKGKNLDPKEVIEFHKELYKKFKKVSPGMPELISKLKKKGLIIACLSDTNEVYFKAHQEQKDLDNFDFAFASFKTGKLKKHEGAFEDVIKELGVKPDEAILIDDSDKKIENAKAHGLKAIKYENYEQLVDELKKFGVEI